MSSTNKTTNYELSQFIGSDKPAWLQDYNIDMGKIDTQMKANADGITSVSGTASATSTALGDITNLTTTDKTSAVAAINETNTKSISAQSLANTANTTANSAKTTAEDLAEYLDLSSITVYNQNPQFTINKGSLGEARITVARNRAGTYAKVYGYVVTTNLSGQSGSLTAKLNVDTGLRPSEKIAIDGTSMEHLYDAKTSAETTIVSTLYINPDGTIEISGDLPDNGSSATSYMRLLACILYIKNFGDQ